MLSALFLVHCCVSAVFFFCHSSSFFFCLMVSILWDRHLNGISVFSSAVCCVLLWAAFVFASLTHPFFHPHWIFNCVLSGWKYFLKQRIRNEQQMENQTKASHTFLKLTKTTITCNVNFYIGTSKQTTRWPCFAISQNQHEKKKSARLADYSHTESTFPWVMLLLISVSDLFLACWSLHRCQEEFTRLSRSRM